MKSDEIIKCLSASQEPAIVYKTSVYLLDLVKSSSEAKKLREGIAESPVVKTLLSERNREGQIPWHPYTKWTGAHWVLASLADLEYPEGDLQLIPLRDQVYKWLYSERHLKSIKSIEGKVRRCASQEGNTVYYLSKLGLADERVDSMVSRLIEWQWDDGGWNCDKSPGAKNSSFHESLIPLRGLALYAKQTGDRAVKEAAGRAAELFLKRSLYQKQSDGSVMHPNFIKLHYPYYWRYNILLALLVMRESGLLKDKRCQAPLELLSEKQQADGSFTADTKYYKVTEKEVSGRSLVNWNKLSGKKMNEFITVDALTVLKEAGRLRG
jgi:hypothetical protein